MAVGKKRGSAVGMLRPTADKKRVVIEHEHDNEHEDYHDWRIHGR